VSTNKQIIDRISRNGLSKLQIKIMNALVSAKYKPDEIPTAMFKLYLKTQGEDYIDDWSVRQFCSKYSKRQGDIILLPRWSRLVVNVRFLKEFKTMIRGIKLNKPVKNAKLKLQLVVDLPPIEYKKHGRKPRLIDMEAK